MIDLAENLVGIDAQGAGFWILAVLLAVSVLLLLSIVGVIVWSQLIDKRKQP